MAKLGSYWGASKKPEEHEVTRLAGEGAHKLSIDRGLENSSVHEKEGFIGGISVKGGRSPNGKGGLIYPKLDKSLIHFVYYTF